jgi:CRP/FNR family cyclic AMP-dependent transcriptional regulator
VVVICHVLREDPDLAEAVPPDRRNDAIEACVAPLVNLRRGRWQFDRLDPAPADIGLLVLDGLILRRVGVDGRFGAELLGEGDLLRPWQRQEPVHSLTQTTGWRVLSSGRLAILNADAARCLAGYPELTGRLVARALERSRNLSVNMAIVHQTRVVIRLQMLFWHMADRWGRVGREGVLLPLQLPHSVLADLVAARRPTVTSALSELARTGVVRSTDGGWLLAGDPPGELLEVKRSS